MASFNTKTPTLVAGSLVVLAWGHTTALAQSHSTLVRDGRMGFVVTNFRYALAPDSPHACPQGYTRGPRDIYAATAEGARRPDESDEAYTRRNTAGARQLMLAPTGENLCLKPTLAQPDPNFRTVTGRDLRAEGINLDGQAGARVAPGTCGHENFRGMNGESGIDNQFYRAVGCLSSFQSTGTSNVFDIGMLAGEWGILIELTGVDDTRNDESVTVAIYANADPIELGPNRDPVPSVTYSAEQDPRFRSMTPGSIVNGVLTAGPVDIRMHKVTNAMRLERVLNRTQLRLTLSAEGVLEGYMSGYTPVDDAYDLQFGHRNGRNAKGELWPAMQVTVSNGSSFVLGYSCPGVYYALRQLADGDRDPATGKCSSLSTHYVVRAIPAFIVQTVSGSVNRDLESGSRTPATSR